MSSAAINAILRNPWLATIPAGIAGIAAFLGIDAARRRRLAMLQARAEVRGLTFDPDRVWYFDDRIGGGFACLRRGADQYASNVMKGERDGLPLYAFDYSCQSYEHKTNFGKIRVYHHFSAVALGSPIPLKDLLIRPEKLIDKVAAFVGAEEINFESAAFSERFRVIAADRKWAYDALHARALEYLLERPDFSIQFRENWTLAWRERKFSPAEFEAATEILAGLLDLLPEYVTREGIAQSERSARWDRKISPR